MNRDTAIASTLGGLVLTILFLAVTPYLNGIYLVLLVSQVMCFAIPFLILGVVGLYENRGIKTTDRQVNEKERAAATMLSVVSGLGHFYMRRYVKGLFFMILFLAFITIFAVGIVLYSDYYYYSYTAEATMFFIYGAIFVFFLWLWSFLDITSICNKENLLYIEESLELKCEKTELASSVLFAITSLLLIIASILMITFDLTPSSIINICIIIFSIFVLIPIAYMYLKKSKNKKDCCMGSMP